MSLYAGLNIIDINTIDINTIEIYLGVVQALKELETEACLGFDTETKPISREDKICIEPTLIQLVTEAKAFLLPTSCLLDSLLLYLWLRLYCVINIYKNLDLELKMLTKNNEELRNKLQIHLLC